MSGNEFDRFESKAEAIKHLMKVADPKSLLEPRYAREVAAPWGKEGIERVDKIECKYKHLGALCPADKTLEDTAVSAYRLIKLLVESEGRKPVDETALGNGFHASANFEANLPLLLDAVNGTSPRDYDGRWRSRLRNKDRDFDIDGLYDDTNAVEK